MGFAKNWKDLVGMRVLLGIMEAAFFPGCVYLLSSWYSRCEYTATAIEASTETGRRRSKTLLHLLPDWLCSIGSIGNPRIRIDADERPSEPKWMELDLHHRRCCTYSRPIYSSTSNSLPQITGVIGLLTFVFLVDFPDKAHKSWRFLTEKECAFIVRRLNRDRSDANNEPFTLKRFLTPALDLKIWGFAMIFLYYPFLFLSSPFCNPTNNQQLHNNSNLRNCLLPPHHPARGHGIRRRRVTMPRRSSLRFRGDRHVQHGLDR